MNDEENEYEEIEMEDEYECPDCGSMLIFMEEKKKYWCGGCGETKSPTTGYQVDEYEGDRKDRVIHGYFDDEKLKEANPLAFYGTVAVILIAVLSLFWFSYTHNPLGVPESFQGQDVYFGFGPFDMMLGYIGWIILFIGFLVIAALIWFRDPANRTDEAEKAHDFMKYGVVASVVGMGAFSLSSLLRAQEAEQEVNLGVEIPPYFAIALIPGIILIIGAVVLFVLSHRYRNESAEREMHSLYFDDIGLTITGDCPECEAVTDLREEECRSCGQPLTSVDLAQIREDMLSEKGLIEEPLEDRDSTVILEGKLPDDYEEELLAEEVLEEGTAMDYEDSYEAEENAEDLVDETIEQEVIETVDEAFEEEPEVVYEEVEEIAPQETVADYQEEEVVSGEPEEPAKICDMCGKELTYIPQYEAWYCYDCEKYEGE